MKMGRSKVTRIQIVLLGGLISLSVLTFRGAFMPLFHLNIYTTDLLETELRSTSTSESSSRVVSSDGLSSNDEDSAYISRVREEVFELPQPIPDTPNFYHLLKQHSCVPGHRCLACLLRPARGESCKTCRSECSCYCEKLQQRITPPKFVSKRISVTPPRQKRDPDRLIPRIVHQTWKEKVTQDRYPNLSRLVESFKQSGWEYRFYNDTEAAEFLTKHFPPEIREAFDSVLPGAFKADLFRYCVLLIYGGIYADIDVMLESTLDVLIPGDVGFVAPIDKHCNRSLCLWNGFMAAAPGHPILAEALETAVNQFRNRFTSLDIDDSFGPPGDISIMHYHGDLFFSGPCVLGGSANRVFGRDTLTDFEPGELRRVAFSTAGGNGSESTKRITRITGRTIILDENENKYDSGGHRFTWAERNLSVAATNLPGSKDGASSPALQPTHYSKFFSRLAIYGPSGGVYINQEPANENIQVAIVDQ